MEKFRGCICASAMIPVSLSHDFNLQQALAGVPMVNQRDRKSFYSPGSITLLAAAAGIMNNSKVFAFLVQPG